MASLALYLGVSQKSEAPPRRLVSCWCPFKPTPKGIPNLENTQFEKDPFCRSERSLELLPSGWGSVHQIETAIARGCVQIDAENTGFAFGCPLKPPQTGHPQNKDTHGQILHQLGLMKPYNHWDEPPTNWSIHSMFVFFHFGKWFSKG